MLIKFQKIYINIFKSNYSNMLLYLFDLIKFFINPFLEQNQNFLTKILKIDFRVIALCCRIVLMALCVTCIVAPAWPAKHGLGFSVKPADRNTGYVQEQNAPERQKSVTRLGKCRRDALQPAGIIASLRGFLIPSPVFLSCN